MKTETEKARLFSQCIKLPWYLHKEENITNFERIYNRKFNSKTDSIIKTIYDYKNNQK